MSADSWDDCPKCKAEGITRMHRDTWRENYEFYGAAEGELHIDYSGSCTECGLSLEFSRVIPFYPQTYDATTRVEVPE